jgi:3,5-epimerase/4-reductase
MKVLIFGAKGFMGRHFVSMYPDSIQANTDIGDAVAVAAVLDQHKPDVVINTAGKTGRPNVDWCEDHKEETMHSNVFGPLVLLEACAKRNIYWVHLSSGCIYEGDNGGRGFTEYDAPNFFGSFYSRTKGWTDQILKDFPVLILRLRMPFDGSDDPRSLLNKLKKYSKVLDEPNSITSIPDFLNVAKKLIVKKKTGIYNMVNTGLISPYQMMQKYKEMVDPSHTFERLTLDHLQDVVKAGRSNCLLAPKRLAAEGLLMPPVEDAVERALTQMKRH